MSRGKVDIGLGLQYGDEGKGKMIDFLATSESSSYGVVARFQGGPNAGHTLYRGGKKIVLHHPPSGILDDRLALCGAGMVINPIIIMQELIGLIEHGIDAKVNLRIAKEAHLILPTHRMMDAANERLLGTGKIGTTLHGIGPTYEDKAGRRGIPIGNIFDDDFEDQYDALTNRHRLFFTAMGFIPEHDIENYASMGTKAEFLAAVQSLREFTFVHCEGFMNKVLDRGMNVLAEGAQGALLDKDLGSYPCVTSSNTTTSGVLNGLCISHQDIGEVFGITKAYCTRVGSGSFWTELATSDARERHISIEGAEKGATTGRPRRIGWLDLPALKYACLINGVTQIILTKGDVLQLIPKGYISVAVAYFKEGDSSQSYDFPLGMETEYAPVYEQFPIWDKTTRENLNFNAYVKYIETYLGIPVTLISNGPNKNQVIDYRERIEA